ncbi:Uncharacterised protein [Klebsiella quasipneumoniae]|nr:hypothetical protein [Klebsiella quasipneumoniae]VGG32636.1 Uncharacterised protein [Klebsiella quasipneumoniae]
MKFPLSTLALLFLLCPPGDAADLFDAEDGMLDMSQYLAENRYGFLPVPLAITEPAIGYGGGLFGLFLHGKGSREGGQFIPPPLTAFGGAATQNGTWFIGGGHRHTWQHDRIRYLAGAGYANVNLDIYSGDTGGFSHAKPVQTQTKGVAALQKLLFAWATRRCSSGPPRCMPGRMSLPIIHGSTGCGSRCSGKTAPLRRWGWWRNMTLPIIFSILRVG